MVLKDEKKNWMILYIDDFEILWMVGFIIVDFR